MLYFAVSIRNFITIYKINRTLHGRLWIRILSSRASPTRERYFQHSKIKFVSPRGHVISSICLPINIPWIKCLRHFSTDKQCIFVGRRLPLKTGPPFTVVIRDTRSSSLLQAFVSQLQ